MTKFYMNEFIMKYPEEFLSILEEESEEVKDALIDSDLALKEITDPVLIQNNPYYCFNNTDDCMFGYNLAKKLTENKIITEYCNTRIAETLEARKHIGSRLPKTNIDEFLDELPVTSRITGPAKSIDQKAITILSTINKAAIKNDRKYCEESIEAVKYFYRDKKMPEEIKSYMDKKEKMLNAHRS